MLGTLAPFLFQRPATVSVERPSPAVFEPLLADLVAADVEVPDLLRHATESDGAGDFCVSCALLRFDGINPDRVVGPTHLLNHYGSSPDSRLADLHRYKTS